VAKTVRTNRTKGIVAVSQKNQYLDRMKAMTKYLVSPDDKLLEKITEDDTDAKKLKYRSISHLVFHPKIISYINKYLNSKYEFSNYDARQWFMTIAKICELYGIRDTNALYFSKFKADEHNDFIKLMKRYYVESAQMQPSPSELNALYILRKYNVIDDEVMSQIKFIIDGKVVKTQKEKKLEQMMGLPNIAVPQTVAVNNENRTFDDLSPNIQKFCKTVNAYIANRQACRSCSLNNKGSIILDTNLQEVGPVDIMVVGLNPGNDEKTAGIPFAGPSGQILRRLLDPIIERLNLTYILTNVILCATVNESEVKRPATIYNNCKQILDEVTKQFNPKLKIVLGAKTLKLVGVKGGITKFNGQIVDGYFVMNH